MLYMYQYLKLTANTRLKKVLLQKNKSASNSLDKQTLQIATGNSKSKKKKKKKKTDK